MRQTRPSWDARKDVANIRSIKDFADGRQWYMLTPMDWEYLARSGHRSMIVEEVQLMAVAADPRVLKHLSNASDRVQRLHAMKWKL